MKWILTLVFICALAAESSAQVSVCVRCPPPAPRVFGAITITGVPAIQPQMLLQPIHVQAAPVQPPPVLLAVPSAIQVQTMIPQARPQQCCGGLLRRVVRRLIHPRTSYALGPQLQYTLQAQPPQVGEEQPSQ
jgi:hypothetical protein